MQCVYSVLNGGMYTGPSGADSELNLVWSPWRVAFGDVSLEILFCSPLKQETIDCHGTLTMLPLALCAMWNAVCMPVHSPLDILSECVTV